MLTFQDREEAIEQICAETGQNVILNIFGEAGIGKTHLLSEARRRLRARSPNALVLYVNLNPIAHTATSRPEGVLRALTTQAQDWLRGVWQEVAQVAGQVVAELIELADRMRVVLMFDTTEALQEDMEFWHWMEANLVGPLIIEGRVQQVFAGRVPAPWRRVEVRRNVKLLPLGPLPRHDAARDYVRKVCERADLIIVTRELNERAKLREFLVSRFNLDELKDLAFDLGVDYQIFPHATLAELSRELIAYFERIDQLSCFMIEVLRRRYDNDLLQLLIGAFTRSSPKKVQIVVLEDLLKDMPEFLGRADHTASGG